MDQAGLSEGQVGHREPLPLEVSHPGEACSRIAAQNKLWLFVRSVNPLKMVTSLSGLEQK